MADSINPRCPVHGVRHKRPMCDPDEVVEMVLKRPYEVGDQLDTDLDADLAGRLTAAERHTLEQGWVERDFTGIRLAVEAIVSVRVAAARAEAWDEGWDERDNYCSEPYSPKRENPHYPPEQHGKGGAR